ncbi:MAG: M1 family aminopeptidase [Terriglobia bacterium]
MSKRRSCVVALGFLGGLTAAAAAGLPSRAAVAQAAAGIPSGPAPAVTDLAAASPDDLLKVYEQLRSLQASDQSAVAENVAWQRDSATFNFKEGRLTFAVPVAGHVVAAVFIGQGTFELDPPTAIDRHQIERFTKEPRLVETFREATFFFTDNSWEELQKLVNIRQRGDDTAAATKILEATQKKFSGEFNEWWSNQAKDSPVMRNLPARLLADLSDPLSHGLLLADIKGDHYGGLLFEISGNRDSILMPFFGRDEEVTLIRYEHNEYSEWWSGFHLKNEYARNPHPEHRSLLTHCSDEHIEAEISKDNHVAATAEMSFVVQGGTARVLPMGLDGVLRVSSITDGAGKKISFIQEDRQLDSDLWVILPAGVQMGSAYKLKISYQEDSTHESRIIHQQGSGLYFVVARESWYPSFGAFDDRTHFTLDFHSPKKFAFVATGRQISSEKGHDDLETKWESEIPYSVVGFNYGDFVDKSRSDPNLTVTVYGGREIPDELKELSSAMDMADMERRGQGGSIESQTGILRGGFNTTAMVGSAADQSYQAFKLYQSYFGPLPFKTISVTEQPVGFFGQSWPTLIFLPYLALLDTTTLHSLRLRDTAEGREFFDIVGVHEMSHQWWGHMVGWKTYHDQWLSEGFADFSAALYLKQLDPKRFRAFWDLQRKWILSKDRAGVRPTDAGPLWLNYQTSGYLEEGNSQILIYRKGSYVLEMLRMLMENPRDPNPDGAFISMMRDFVSTYAGKNASTQDFKQVVEKHFGQPMDWFFNEWVYGTAVPHYDFDYGLKDAGGGKTTLHVSLQQSEVPDDFMMPVPIYASVDRSTRRLGLIQVKGNATFEKDYPLPFHPEKVWMDEYHSVLSKEKQ